MVSGSISNRQRRLRSSGVRSSGLFLVIPSFARRPSKPFPKVRLPFLSAGHRRLNNCSSVAPDSCSIRASIAAARRLFAAVMAWMSPVRCRLKSSMGITWLYPPPAAPPLIPNVGPWLGWRMQVITLFCRWAPRAWLKPTVVVVLPSPKGVGVMAVTSTYFPFGWSFKRSRISSLTFALKGP